MKKNRCLSILFFKSSCYSRITSKLKKYKWDGCAKLKSESFLINKLSKNKIKDFMSRYRINDYYFNMDNSAQKNIYTIKTIPFIYLNRIVTE